MGTVSHIDCQTQKQLLIKNLNNLNNESICVYKYHFLILQKWNI